MSDLTGKGIAARLGAVVDSGATTLYGLRYLVFGVVLTMLAWGLFRERGPEEAFAHAAVVLHLLAFLGLALSARFAFDRLPGLWIWLALLALAVGSEFLQAWLRPETRVFSPLDIVGNLLGVAAAMALWWAVQYARRQMPPTPGGRPRFFP